MGPWSAARFRSPPVAGATCSSSTSMATGSSTPCCTEPGFRVPAMEPGFVIGDIDGDGQPEVLAEHNGATAILRVRGTTIEAEAGTAVIPLAVADLHGRGP